ncbi:tRNA adenosine(34) deaminase TadA [Venatoribacter cucullus]|uniref:tRNA-specific adenosine deaminase n=1 Tax=Venatoribacter cucullus TaxID=2661630 RepID=A0A9X7UZ73_9GAMM|nr:tRNA adenosine(34) deaminase TadA [Venatoribacter cucullus]QQD24756.1 tRNA adenosine(34) deaminase TadA [Venatoribacter cucullus]
MTSSVNSAAPADLLGQPVSTDNEAMQLALQLARRAFDAGEVPVGALVVQAGKVIGQGYNQPITTLDPSAHAEMVAVRQAAATVGNYRLSGATLYVTVEPCTMCTGLLIHSRISRLVFGATEPKAGAVVSALQLPQQSFYNHVLQADGGVMAEECAALMSEFFALRRAAQKRLKAQAATKAAE